MLRSLLFLMVGPSGSGKTTIIDEVRKQIPDLAKYVTCTTRKPREGEEDGVSYHFLTQRQFNKLRDSGQLVEWEDFYLASYGSRRSDIMKAIESTTDHMSSTDVMGALTLQALFPDNVVTIFVVPDDPATLRARIRKRLEDGQQTLEETIEREKRFDLEMVRAGCYRYAVYNAQGHLDDAVRDVAAIVRAERCARFARQKRAEYLKPSTR